MKIKIELAEPRGFCAGVKRALEIAEKTLAAHPGETLYFLHDLVHNGYVAEHFRKLGAVVTDDPAAVPPGSRVLVSAHGAGKAVFDGAHARKWELVDATCPLVRQVQMRAEKCSREGRTILLIGHLGHREVEGVLGWIPGPCRVLENRAGAEEFQPETGKRYTCLSQTTLHADEVAEIEHLLRAKCPDLETGGSVCAAARERQDAVRKLAAHCGVMLIVGSRNSSNTLRLLETAARITRSYLVAGPEDVTPEMIENVKVMGIASGASAPESLVRAVIGRVERLAGS